MRSFSIRCEDLLTAISFVYGVCTTYGDAVESASVASRADGAWPATIVLAGPRADEVLDRLLRQATDDWPRVIVGERS